MTEERTGRWLAWGLVAVLLWAPLPLGSNRPWALAILEAGVFTLAALGLARIAIGSGPFPSPLRAVRRETICLALWLAYLALQAVPVPAAVVQLLAQETFHLRAEAAVLGVASPSTLSLDPGATLAKVTEYGCYVAVFLLAFVAAHDRRSLRLLLIAFLLAGAAEALFGLVVYLSGAPTVQEILHLRVMRRLSGTYVNRNHFAGLLEMAIPAGIGLVLSTLEPGFGSRFSLRALLHDLTTVALTPIGLLAFCLALMAGALVLSASRAGIGALGAGCVLTATYAGFTRGRHAPEVKLLPWAIVVGVVAVLWLGLGALPTRLETEGLRSNRTLIRESIYPMIEARPLVGSGAGTFRWVFPAYQREVLEGGIYEHAHNDYLEVLAEEGIVGFALLAAAVGSVYRRLLRGYRARNDPLARGALFAAIAGVTSLLVHGLVDFNLQIPANAALFAALLGTGLAATRVAGPVGQPGRAGRRLATR